MEPCAVPGAVRVRPRSRWRWVGFFLVLALLATVAATIPVVINLRQQLRPEQLDEARARWREQGPENYDLEYTIRLDRDPVPERYLVQVRDGRALYAARDGEAVYLAPALGALVGLPARALAGAPGAFGVDAVFARIDEALRQEEATGRRNYLMAIFDVRLGHPKRFVYRARGQREEWNLLLKPKG